MRRPAIALLGLLAAGCANGGPQPPPLVAEDAPAAAAQTQQTGFDRRIGVLPPRERLEAGACGLYIWSVGDRRRLVLYSTNRLEGAKMMVDGREQMLRRTAAEGNPALGQFNRQTFAAEDLTVRLSIDAERRAGIIDGAVVPRGSLRVIADDGWEIVMPVVGLIACG